MQLVQTDLAGARVLDLFAGTGAVGLEALSRGAASCDFVENHPSALHSLKANVAVLRVRDRTRIFKHDAIPFTERLEPGSYDVAFADPPYGSRKLDRVLSYWAEVPFSTVLLVEHAPDHALPLRGSTRHLGDAAVTVYRAPKGVRT
jgi:16S rRNA (guanine966-N2)-methyltransferase